jgi:UDP-glucose:(heptosyl)LPS alpha-1,3-glucosyltransferase
MKIGLVRRGYSVSGGAERYLLRFAAALREAGHEGVLFASEEWPDGVWDGELIRVKGGGPRAFADGLQVAKPREYCDLLFSLERVWECDTYRAGDGVHRAWLTRRKAFEPRWKGWYRGMQGKHREILELEEVVFTKGAKRVIIANSRMVAGEITKYFDVPPERVKVIYNGIPTPKAVTPARRAELRAGLGLAAEQCVVLFAGSGWERKGLRFAIEAINLTKDAILLVAGRGKRRGLPASQRTRFLESVQDMAELMETADIFVLPTIYDPFSNASLEALAAGLPVITTSANGFSEIMREGIDGTLVNPDDVGGIAKSIDEILPGANREERRAAARRYTIEANVEATLAALGVPVRSR